MARYRDHWREGVIEGRLHAVEVLHDRRDTVEAIREALSCVPDGARLLSVRFVQYEIGYLMTFVEEIRRPGDPAASGK